MMTRKQQIALSIGQLTRKLSLVKTQSQKNILRDSIEARRGVLNLMNKKK